MAAVGGRSAGGGRSSCNDSAEHLPLMVQRGVAGGDDSKDEKMGRAMRRRPAISFRISGTGAAGTVIFALAFAGLVAIFISIQNTGTPRATASSSLALHDLDETTAGKVKSVATKQGQGQTAADREEQTRGGVSGTGAAPPASKPNLFFIMIDDLGWDDIGYQSSDLVGITPNMDKLAAGGVKMTNYYSMSICTPARASLMTGRYPIRYGLQYNVIQPGAPWGLPLTEKIFPEYMKDVGYVSHMVGKWHLGSYRDVYTPHRRGFDTYLGYLNDKEMYWTHQMWTAQLHGRKFFDFGFGNVSGYYDVIDRTGAPLPPIPIRDNDGDGDDDGDDDYDDDDFSTGPTSSSSSSSITFNGIYSTTVFQERAMEVLRDKTPYDENPLFLYLAHQAVHDPLGLPPSDAFTAEEWAILDALEESSRSSLRLRFAKVLMYLDKTIGELVAYLEAEGWMENSIIAVASDNGGCPESGGSNYPLRGIKHSYWEGGVKVPAFVYSKSHIPEEAWGTEYKGLMHVTDFLPTLASAIDLKLTGSYGDFDGVDHWAHITNPDLVTSIESPRTEMLYNFDPYVLWADGDAIIAAEYPLNQGAYRRGKWKLIINEFCQGYYTFDRQIQATDYLTNENNTCLGVESCTYCGMSCSENSSYTDGLFDLETDPREEHNLVDLYPEVVDGLRSRIQEVVDKEYTNSSFDSIDEDAYKVWAAHDYWAMPWFDYLQELVAANESSSSDGGEGDLSR